MEMILGSGRGMRLDGGEHEQDKGRCALFLLSLIGRDPLSLTFCTPSLVFHMLILDRPEEETCWSWVDVDKDSLSYSLPPFHTISPLFLPLPLSSNLTDFGMKGSECFEDEKGGDAILTVTHATCEDQVCCSDPRLCVRWVVFGVALVVCIDIWEYCEPRHWRCFNAVEERWVALTVKAH